MASSLFTNTLHISFDSVLTMDHEGMVAMFKALVATGLKDYLGCPGVIYEDELIEFFQNGSVRDGMVVSTVNGKTVEISEELFAETFQLPVEGLTDMNDVPKDMVFDARSVFSYDGTQIETSGKKRKMKFEFRLLNDILAKSVTVKAGSFDTVTLERFMMMAAINGGIPINWSKVLFNIFKDMVTTGSRQAKGFSIQISLLLEDVPNLELRDSSEFPSSRILTERTVHRYIVINDTVGMEEVADISRVKKTPKKNAVSRKRPAAVTDVEPAIKKNRTSKSKSVSSKDNLDILPVAQEAVPLQTVAPTMEDEPVLESIAEEVRTTFADDMDIIIEQVVAETAQLEMDEGEPDVSKTDVGAQETHRADETDQWFNLSYEELYAADRQFETASDTDEDIETVDFGTAVGDQLSETSSCRLWLKMSAVPMLQLSILRQSQKFSEARKINFLPGDGSSATDLKVLEWLSDLHMFLIEELKEQTLAHGLSWEKTCCSKLFEGRPRDRGAVIVKSNTNFRSSCWIRTMIKVDGSWVMERARIFFWKPLPRPVVCTEVQRQLSYVDTLPPVSEFFKVMKKQWADVCMEVSKFFVSEKLLSVGSLNFYRALSVVESVPAFEFRRPNVTSWGWSTWAPGAVVEDERQYVLLISLLVIMVPQLDVEMIQLVVPREVDRVSQLCTMVPQLDVEMIQLVVPREIEHAGSLGSIGLNGVGDDPVNFIQTGVRCGSGTNQAEASGHVMPGAQKRAGSDRRCQEVARTMSGSWCGSGTNQAEASGHVMPGAQKRAGSDRRCQEVARTMSGSW
ncbi:hypothetical protein F511_02736 [Dorcoceras hygrometricum]|uniref:Dystroglycan-like n=1 Tax=Dorcoceras hygrometricum TaxID=472368 RepID=A0A2Z7DJB4_9LAMI|nr:hypothetical protein F511_02736 [Dorcoceras hygrometricum]